MWSEIIGKFKGMPSQEKVIRLLLERGFQVSPDGHVVSGKIIIPHTQIAREAGVDRRVVDATTEMILRDDVLKRVFQNIRSIASLRDVAPLLGLGVIIITPDNAQNVGIIHDVSRRGRKLPHQHPPVRHRRPLFYRRPEDDADHERSDPGRAGQRPEEAQGSPQRDNTIKSRSRARDRHEGVPLLTPPAPTPCQPLYPVIFIINVYVRPRQSESGMDMSGKLEDIELIAVSVKSQKPAADQPSAARDFEVRDRIVERIRRIAGKDSVKRVAPIQHQGDHQEQDIVFEMGDASYLATVRYNNSLTEGWVSDLKKDPRKC